MTTNTWYWHVHHDMLCEPLTGQLEERIAYILASKPRAQHALRLRLLRPVHTPLPRAYRTAAGAYQDALQAYTHACKDFSYANEQFFVDKKAYILAHARRTDTRSTYVRAETAYVRAYARARAAIDALHQEECPGCPWDGKTIFGAQGGVPWHE